MSVKLASHYIHTVPFTILNRVIKVWDFPAALEASVDDSKLCLQTMVSDLCVSNGELLAGHYSL